MQVLDDLEARLKAYDGLSTIDKRAFDKSASDVRDLSNFAEDLKCVVDDTLEFYSDLKMTERFALCSRLSMLASDYKNGHRESPHLALLVMPGPAWEQAKGDLKDVGIASDVAETNRQFISEWLRMSMRRDVKQESVAPSVRTASVSGPSAPVQQPAVHVPSTEPIPQSPLSSDTPGLTLPIHDTTFEQQLPQHFSIFSDLPEYNQSHTNLAERSPVDTTALLHQTTRDVVKSWNAQNWSLASDQLQSLISLSASTPVTNGTRDSGIGGKTPKPDTRMLHHLLAVSASFSGDYPRAKELFSNLVNENPFVHGAVLHPADIAAASWLGDLCLFLNEPENAAFAWSVALSGSWKKTPLHRQPTCRMLEELRMLDTRLAGLKNLERYFKKRHEDKTTIFTSTDRATKVELVAWALKHCESVSSGRRDDVYVRPSTTGLQLTENFLLQPLVNEDLWPLLWDPFFCPYSTIELTHRLRQPEATANDLDSTKALSLPNESSKASSLAYTTSKPAMWLLHHLVTCLSTLSITYTTSSLSSTGTIFCILSQKTPLSFPPVARPPTSSSPRSSPERTGDAANPHPAFSEAVEIKIRKVQKGISFLTGGGSGKGETWGFKVSDAFLQMRSSTGVDGFGGNRGGSGGADLERRKEVGVELARLLREFCERKEVEEGGTGSSPASRSVRSIRSLTK